jgi:DNA polymerase I-like protein with 3'-5' exonuclease and polymerase domains
MQEKSYVLVDSLSKYKDMINHVKDKEIISFDIETNSLNTRTGKVIGFSVSAEVGQGYYLPTMIFSNGELIDSKIEDTPSHNLAKKYLSFLIGKKIIAHNFAFDGPFIKNFYGIDLLPSLYADTLLLVHTVQEEGAGFGSGKPFGLKELAKSIQKEIGLDVEKEANEEQLELKASIKANGGSISKDNYEIYKADLNILAKYAIADTDLTLRVYNYFIAKLYEEGLDKLFFEDEVMPLYKEVTIPMEQKGVRLDMELISQTYSELQDTMKQYLDKVTEQLMAKQETKLWVVIKATDAYPFTNKGQWVNRYLNALGIEFPKSEKTGKFNLNEANIRCMPDGDLKEFLVTGDQKYLDNTVATKISLEMWKEQNDGLYFNIQSKDQLGEIAFGALGIKPLSQTKKGKPQFDDDLIQSIADKHEWAKNLRIYNRLLKIKSTYVERFLEREENGRYFFYYKQHGTVSGRYGSDAQQLPRPKEEGDDDPIVIEFNNRVRAFFIHDEGNIFIDNDYESLEPHVFAHVSGDDGLKDIFRNNWDFYSTIAIKTEKLDQYSPDKKAENYLRKEQPKMRNKAKAYALGIPYGMGAYALGKNINISTKEAKVLVEGYLSGFPELKRWMEESTKFVKENGYITTQVGRIRHLPKVKQIFEQVGDGMLDYNFVKQLERKHGVEKVKSIKRDFINGVNNSCNVQIQGLASSIVNRAAIAINRKFKQEGINGWVCAQIHDQIICEVECGKAEQGAKIVQDCMENTTKLSIDLKAPPVIAHNWRDGHA